MSRDVPNCYQSKHGVWYFRISIPRKILSSSRRREIRRSLQTRSQREALKRAAYWRVRCDTLFQSVMSKEYDNISEELEDEILAQLEMEELAKEPGIYASHESELSVPTEQELRERARSKLEVRAIRIEDELEAERQLAILREEARKLEVERGLPMGTLMTDKERAAPVLVSSAFSEYIRLSVEANKHMSDRERNRIFSPIRFFIGLIGDIPLNRLSPQVGAEFYELLLKSSANVFTKHRLPKEAPLNESLPKNIFFECAGVRVTPDSAREKISGLDKFVKWAFPYHGLTKGFDSLGDSIIAQAQYDNRKANSKRKALTDEQVEILLSLNSLTKYKDHPTNSLRFWMPAIMAYSGCRNSEAVWLTESGIVCDQDTGIYCFSFRDELAMVKGTEVLLRRVKADNSIRLVPIHSQLIEWGILDHWQLVQADSSRTYIFHARPPGMRDSVSNTQSNKVTDALKEMDVYEKDCVVAYSLRHRFINKISEQGLDVQQVGYFVGHVDQDDKSAVTTSTTVRHYLKDASIKEMQSVIEALPRIA